MNSENTVLANPYTFGFFEAMAHNKAQRFSHTFVINEAEGLPEKHRGMLFAVEPFLQFFDLAVLLLDLFILLLDEGAQLQVRVPGSAGPGGHQQSHASAGDQLA